MNQVIWRLHRNQARFAAAGFAAVAVVIVFFGLHIHDTYHLIQTCAAYRAGGDHTHWIAGGCLNAPGIPSSGLSSYFVAGSIMVLPGLLGLFWGVPLVAKELEDGTNVLAWTQSVTRRRWISTNIGWALLASAIFGAAVSALVSWWRVPANALNRGWPTFDIQGLVPVAYCVFAVALGIAVGVLLKRVLPALATTLGVLVGVRVAVDNFLRPHFLTPLSRTAPGDIYASMPASLSKAWVLSQRLVDAAGHVVDWNSPSYIPAACQGDALGNQDFNGCLAAHGYRTLVVFQPANRFWTFQAIESALFLALAAALVAFSYRRVIRRDA
jgi:hypothetical protein